MQKSCESLNVTEELAVKAANEKDPILRMCHTLGHYMGQFFMTNNRIKKPFNPMLGETYELVTEEFRYFSE